MYFISVSYIITIYKDIYGEGSHRKRKIKVYFKLFFL